MPIYSGEVLDTCLNYKILQNDNLFSTGAGQLSLVKNTPRLWQVHVSNEFYTSFKSIRIVQLINLYSKRFSFNPVKVYDIEDIN